MAISNWTRSVLTVSFILLVKPPLRGAENDASVVQLLSGASQTALDGAVAQSQLLVQAVFSASQAQGNTRVVTTGTITQRAPDLQSFSYEAVPQDGLILRFFNGMTVRFQVSDFRGDYSRGANSFLSGPHSISFTSQKESEWDIAIASVQWNGSRQAQVKGSAVYEKMTFQVDLQLSGTYAFDIDSSGSEYHSQYQVGGAIQTSEAAITIQEAHDGKVVSARDNHGRYTIVSSSERVSANNMKLRDDHYQLGNVKIRKVFRNGKPSDPDFWLGSGGSILKNGQSIATVRAVYEYPYAKIKAFFANGTALELEKWLIDANPKWNDWKLDDQVE